MTSAAAASLNSRERWQNRAETQMALEEGAAKAPDEHRSERHSCSRALAQSPGHTGCARRRKDLSERRVRADRRGREPLVDEIIGAQLAQASIKKGGVHKQKVAKTKPELAT